MGNAETFFSPQASLDSPNFVFSLRDCCAEYPKKERDDCPVNISFGILFALVSVLISHWSIVSSLKPYVLFYSKEPVRNVRGKPKEENNFMFL